MILLPEGYWQNGVYYYYLKDHLGSNRVVINCSGVVMEYNNYYPSGIRYQESITNSAALPYRYNNKELETMNGLNQYDYGARRRNTGMPVWTSIDPLCEVDYSISPYAYVHDNFINRTDPTGKYDLPEVTIIGNAPSNVNNNNDNDWAIRNFINQLTNEAKYMPKYTPTMSSPKPISYSSTKNIVLNLPNIMPPKMDTPLENISKAVGATGLAADNIKLFTVNNAGKEIVYVTVKGANAALDAQKVIGVLKGISNATIVVGIALDAMQVAADPSYLGKATINTTVAVVAGIIGGVPGLVIGGAYLILDQMGAFDKEYHPGIGIKEVCPTDAIKAIH